VFVPGALPGETVEIELSEARGGYRSARLLAINAPSPDRIAPACPLYGRCGGCDLQHAAHPAQLRYKLTMLEDTLRRQGGFGPDGVLPEIRAIEGPAWAYRNRLQLHPLADGSGFGLKQRESDRLVAVSDCPVAAAEIREWLRTARPAPGQAENGPAGRPAADPDGEPDGAGGRYPIYGARGAVCAGGGEVMLDITGRPISFSVEGFFQSNLVMLEKLAALVTGWVADMGPIGLAADLYCGCGLFAALLPESVKRIVAVDNLAANCRHARTNVDPGRTEVFEGDVDDWLAGRPGPEADLFVVDPPRTGLSRNLVSHLADAKARNLVYISCNPVTFSRDLKELRRAGYVIRKLALLDFYPQTTHMETACWLELVP
jgi:23S rRNA (uracil1939-C5)-methyltransferase